MDDNLADIFEAVSAPDRDQDERPVFAMLPVPSFESYLVGKDGESCACLLIATAERDAGPPPPIRLESPDAQFAVRCHLKSGGRPSAYVAAPEGAPRAGLARKRGLALFTRHLG